MYDDIEPGSSVRVTVVRRPTNAAATKTLVRILSKDEDVRQENRRYAKLRKVHYRPGKRGGRLYGGRMIKLRAVKGILGDTGTMPATVDVLRDLESVSRFIEVAKV